MRTPAPNTRIRVAVLTVSDRCHQGLQPDVSGPSLARAVRERGWSLDRVSIAPDEPEAIGRWLAETADSGQIDVILTTGGTGFTDRDRTPEATLGIAERLAPGLAEAIRARGAEKTPMAYLSRAVAVLRGRVLIVNLPGSPAGAVDALSAIERLLPHAVDQLIAPRECGPHRPHPRSDEL